MNVTQISEMNILERIEAGLSPMESADERLQAAVRRLKTKYPNGIIKI